jgi:phage terminase large subunit
MEQYELYETPSHVRTEQTYNYPSGSYMEFFSVDDHLKVRGPGRDILFINEANLIDFDTFTQLLLRTKKCAFLDYNPADEFHWIYDKVLTRPDCAFIKSTYKDNPFLPNEQIKEIKNLKTLDENFWRIYGEGERGHSEGIIYTNWNSYNATPNGPSFFGLDFGFNNPSSLVKVTESDKSLYVEELIYQSQLTNPDLISLLKQILPAYATVYCDTAEPARIEELRRAGIKAIPANKDVKDGILFLKSRSLFIHTQSVNLLKEIKSYKFLGKENKDMIPLKVNDHAMDAMRYATTGLRMAKTQSYPQFIR